MTPQAAIARVVEGRDLSAAEMAAVVESLLTGGMSAAQMGAFLVGLRIKGETVDELTAAARVLRAHAVMIPDVPAGAVDTCGTGGDGAATLNVSTTAALVVAGAGVPVAKHGNRAVSSMVGSADVLEALGVTLELDPPLLATCLRSVGFAFLFAPALQPALRHAAAPRRELGLRTLFNLLGPLANPAGVRRQVIGVSEGRWVEPLAHVLRQLGAERAWVVHGGDGLDELTLAGESIVAEVAEGTVRTRAVRASDAGLAAAPSSVLRVSSTAEAAARLRAILAGEAGAGRDVVCLNAAAALLVAGAAPDLRAGVARARQVIDSGAATGVLERLVAFTAHHAATGRVMQ